MITLYITSWFPWTDGMNGRNHVLMNVSHLILLEHAMEVKTTWLPVAILPYVDQFLRHILQNKTPFPDAVYHGLCVMIFMIGSLAPDADHHASLFSQYIHIPFVGHRRWTHTAYACLIQLPLVWYDGIWFWFTLGYFLHLVWDDYSVRKIHWFVLPKKTPKKKENFKKNKKKNSRKHRYSHKSRRKRKKSHKKRFYLYKVGQRSEKVILWMALIAAGYSVYVRLF